MSLLWASGHPYVAVLTGGKDDVETLMDVMALLGMRVYVTSLL